MLAIALVVSVGVSMLIGYLYYQDLLRTHFRMKSRSVKNLETAKFIALNEFEDLAYDKPLSFDLYGEGNDRVSMTKSPWGVWDIYELRTANGQFRDSLIILRAPYGNKLLRSPLHLIDEGRPLAVVGNTRIEGEVYLPLAGVQSAYIGRMGYTNDSLLYGIRRQSLKKLPELGSEEVYDRLKRQIRLSSNYPNASDKLVKNSFWGSTIKLEGSVQTLKDHYSGNIVLTASRKLIFDSLAATDNIIAFAPSIEFKGGFNGSGQFFATDTVIVDSQAQLVYPSLLYVYNEQSLGSIQLKDGSSVEGWLIMDGDDRIFRQRVISITPQAQLRGHVYCNGYMELFGKINGHILTRRFLVNDFSGVYENYLMNATLKSEINKDFAAMWFDSSAYQVLKYLP